MIFNAIIGGMYAGNGMLVVEKINTTGAMPARRKILRASVV